MSWESTIQNFQVDDDLVTELQNFFALRNLRMFKKMEADQVEAFKSKSLASELKLKKGFKVKDLAKFPIESKLLEDLLVLSLSEIKTLRFQRDLAIQEQLPKF